VIVLFGQIVIDLCKCSYSFAFIGLSLSPSRSLLCRVTPLALSAIMVTKKEDISSGGVQVNKVYRCIFLKCQSSLLYINALNLSIASVKLSISASNLSI
jgi:hypothetical protein